MEYSAIIDEIFEKGKNKLEDMEVYIQENNTFKIGVFQGELDDYSIANTRGLSLRASRDGKIGYSYTETIDPLGIDNLVKQVYENAIYTSEENNEEIQSSSLKVDEVEDTSWDGDVSQKIEFLKKLEKEALELDDRVIKVEMTSYMELTSSREIANTKGVRLKDSSRLGLTYISIILKDGDGVKTHFDYRTFKSFEELNYKEFAKELVENGLKKLSANSMESGEYPVIIENETFASLLSAFSGIFSSENTQKGLSKLGDKLGGKVASELLSIIDNPKLDHPSVIKSNFDDEATGTQELYLIKNGRLENLLYNSKTAKKEGKQSTGHGYRGSYKSSINIRHSNLYVKEGKRDLEEMAKDIDKGLIVNDIQGLHSGLNPVSGDFSVPASGFIIEDGQIKGPIDNITISSNFYDLIENIKEIGSDLKFSIPSSGSVGSPSIYFKSISVAGSK